MQFGFVLGLMGGFLTWLVLNGYVILNPALTMVKGWATIFAFVIFVVAVGVQIGSIIKGKAFFSTTKDGFVYGFTAAFDILYIFTQLSLGNLPLP